MVAGFGYAAGWDWGRGSVGEGSANSDEGLVGDDSVGDEDGGAQADAERYNGAVTGVDVAEHDLEVAEERRRRGGK